MKNFSGKTVVITGASAGIGKACARAFAGAGAKLALVARGREKLTGVADQLRKTTEVREFVMDVGNLDDCDRLLEETHRNFGNINILINNAGMHERGDLETIDARAVAQMVDINMRAPLYLSAASLPYLRQSESSAIVYVGSLAGLAPLPGAATYSGTKAGMRAFGFAMADEMRGSNVQVGIVSPGPVATGFIMENIDNVEDIVFSQPMSTAEQVADAVLVVAGGHQTEVAMPSLSGKLAAVSYNFPSIRRFLRPVLYAIGKKNKRKYKTFETDKT